MCGIAGFWGGFTEDLLERMTDTLAHRGPDGVGTQVLESPRIGLGHRRLSIIDLSERGAQPMWDADERGVLVYNGELYNYRELREELRAQGMRFQSDTDSEVLLNYVLAHGVAGGSDAAAGGSTGPGAAAGSDRPTGSAGSHGVAALNRLNGMYAFAYWDKASREFLIARDPYGIKPLYYTWTPSGLLFASEMKSILQSDEVDRTLDPRSILSYLAYMYSPGEGTPLASVKKLLPGHVLRVKPDGEWSVERFAPMPFHELGTGQQPPPPLPTAQPVPSPATAAQQVRDSLSTAVERQLVADVPVGTFLSGGLDSSAVTAYAALHRERDLDCFTITHDPDMVAAEGVVEDWPYAERVAQHLGVRLHRIHIGSDHPTPLARMIEQLDEPQPDLAALSVEHICGLARDHGVKVLLSGAGGDDVFSGYRRHMAVGLESAWRYLPRALRSAIARGGQVVSNRGHLGRRVAKAVRYADHPAPYRLAALFLWLDPDELTPLLGPKLRDLLAGGAAGGGETAPHVGPTGPGKTPAQGDPTALGARSIDPRDPLVERLAEMNPDLPDLHKVLALEFAGFLPDHNLNYTDKMSMAESVETRVPLLDPDLIALAASLPPNYKQRGKEGKWILKKAMEPLLPRSVIYRSKSGFMAPVRRTLHHELGDMAKDLLFGPEAEARGLFDTKAVRRLWNLNEARKIDASYTLLAMVCVEMWVRRWVD